ncbi:hypothetical protein ENSA7_22270 [Enhygromyxa salina]|uniref:Thioredoxin domain-containing protein n=2 Tax=Enhygromyxa salina TaxID=215803 RepID=A0A2S9YSK8_9BACT|nr:hypothetical protein ENSA7_22270 [Enhygromyxa salina]
MLLFLTLGCDAQAGDGVGSDAATEDTSSDTTGGPAGPSDADQDGLTDEQEAEHGTDPHNVDTDADGYWDSWELTEGTDPLDYDSRIYTGFWPYNPDKDALDPGSWDAAGIDVGARVPREAFLDRHGELVDLYDFTNYVNADDQRAYVMFDLSAQWCGPCHAVADWLWGEYEFALGYFDPYYPTVREKVARRRVWWITFLVQNNDGEPAAWADVAVWYDQHPDDKIPLLVDPDGLIFSHYRGSGFPHFMLIGPEMLVKYRPGPDDQTSSNPYPPVGVVDEYL